MIQPIAAIGELVRQRREAARSAGHRLKLHFHVDATQAVGKLPVDVVAAGVDLLTLSGHKFHGPKGVGALFVRSGVRLRAVNRGGPQEREKRGGTENTAGIIGLGVAAELARGFVNDGEAVARCRALRDRFEAGVRAAVPEVVVNSRDPTPGVPGGGGLSAQDSRLRTQDSRLWNTSNLAFAGLEAEAILLGLSEQGLCASAGAACSSGSLEPSPVLRAMGIDEPTAHGSVRFSLSRYTTRQEIDEAVALVPRVVARLGRTMPVGG